MTDPQSLARPYAKAIFEFAKENQNFEAWVRSLKFLALVVQDKKVLNLIHNPEVSPEKASAFFIEMAGKRLDEYGHNFIKLLAHSHRLGLLPQIKESFEAMLEASQQILPVELYIADHVSLAKQKEFEEILSHKLKKKIKMQVIQDASLIGGFLLKSGSTVIDASLLGQLQQLKKNMGG